MTKRTSSAVYDHSGAARIIPCTATIKSKRRSCHFTVARSTVVCIYIFEDIYICIIFFCTLHYTGIEHIENETNDTQRKTSTTRAETIPRWGHSRTELDIEEEKTETHWYQLLGTVRQDGGNRRMRHYFTRSNFCGWIDRSFRRLNRLESPRGPRVKLFAGLVWIALNVALRLCYKRDKRCCSSFLMSDEGESGLLERDDSLECYSVSRWAKYRYSQTMNACKVRLLSAASLDRYLTWRWPTPKESLDVNKKRAILTVYLRIVRHSVPRGSIEL